MPTPRPYWRLSAFYLSYFGALGALVPYWALYLKSLDFSAQAIGELMAILMATRIVAPNLWGWLADRSGRRMPVVRLGSLLAAITFFGVFFGQTYLWLALVMTGFSFFWNAVLPQFEATTLNHLGPNAERYSRVRVWGSIGFIVTAGGLGPLLEEFGTGLLLPVLAALFAAIWVSTLFVEDPPGPAAPHPPGRLAAILGRRDVLAFLAVCFLMQASHGPYYSFYSIYLEETGHGRALIGQLWVLGVVAEIGVFMVMHRLLPGIGAKVMLLVSLSLAAVRWLLIGWFVDSLPLLMLAQVLHAASFGSYHAAAMYLVHQLFVGRHQGRGQALYSSVSFGAGGALGSLGAGYLWAPLGGAWVYTLAAVTSLLAVVVAWYGVRGDAARNAAPDG